MSDSLPLSHSLLILSHTCPNQRQHPLACQSSPPLRQHLFAALCLHPSGTTIRSQLVLSSEKLLWEAQVEPYHHRSVAHCSNLFKSRNTTAKISDLESLRVDILLTLLAPKTLWTIGKLVGVIRWKVRSKNAVFGALAPQ